MEVQTGTAWTDAENANSAMARTRSAILYVVSCSNCLGHSLNIVGERGIL
jgi:hypothetical protein